MSGTNRGAAGDGELPRGEAHALALIASMLPGPPEKEVWIGDDAAVVALPTDSDRAHPDTGARLLLTADTVVEGVHADLSLVGLDDFGFRAVTTAVSDIAAMGGTADSLLVSVAGPPMVDLRRIYEGISEASELCRASVVGGELTTSPTLVITVAVVGHLPGGSVPVLRSGARPGDALFVTGPLGAAAAGLRLLRGGAIETTDEPLVRAHSRPMARLREGVAARVAGATAMIDLSDGFCAGIREMAGASGVGVQLLFTPVADGATLNEALCGGDDYELLIATPDAEGLTTEFREQGLTEPLFLGTCSSDPSELVIDGHPLPDCGWEHPFDVFLRPPL
ncbi:MAG: thiamine-phosphate kinase [Acidimicrobiales bacterium]